jgi:hypothetical protein
MDTQHSVSVADPSQRLHPKGSVFILHSPTYVVEINESKSAQALLPKCRMILLTTLASSASVSASPGISAYTCAWTF